MLNAIKAAFREQWKSTALDLASWSMLFETLPTAAVLAWLAMQSKTPSVLTYMLVGIPLMAMCNGLLFKVGWSLNNELWGRTLDFALISRTPLTVILLGKSLAQLVFRLPQGAIALIAMFIITHQIPHVASLPLLLLSLIFIFIGLIALSLFLAPFMVIVGGKAGFFNAIMPLAVVLSGFMFPIDRLPLVLEIIAKFIPTSWAMSCIWQAINGPDSAWSFISAILACLLTSGLLLVITYYMCKIVEKKLRITGELATY